MPGLVPPVTDERTGLLSYLAQQRAGIRYATHGLTDAQAMTRPSVSELSLGGLVKHAALVEQAWVAYIEDGDMSVFLPEYDWADGFRLVDGETLADVVSFSAEVARTTEKVVTDLPDLGTPLRGHRSRRALDPRRPGLVAALGPPPPHRRDRPPRRARRHRPRVAGRRHVLDAHGGGGGMALRSPGNSPSPAGLTRACR